MITKLKRALNLVNGEKQAEMPPNLPIQQANGNLFAKNDGFLVKSSAEYMQAEMDKVVEQNVALIYKALFNSEPPKEKLSK